MAFAATNLTAYPQSFSIGPKRIQVLSYSAASGDTSGTATADRLTRIDAVISVTGPLAAAAISISTNVATLTFTDPVATVSGTITVIGV